MRRLITLTALLAAGPAFAAESEAPFFSLYNVEGVVALSFLLFIGVLVYLKVPSRLTRMLDDRAENIRAELNEAKALREEAQSILASYERKQQEVKEHAERIIEHAKAEAEEAAARAKDDLKRSIARRMAAAEEQIASAEAAALREVRDRAIQVAVAAAADVISAKMTDDDRSRLVDEAIETVSAKLH